MSPHCVIAKRRSCVKPISLFGHSRPHKPRRKYVFLGNRRGKQRFAVPFLLFLLLRQFKSCRSTVVLCLRWSDATQKRSPYATTDGAVLEGCLNSNRSGLSIHTCPALSRPTSTKLPAGQGVMNVPEGITRSILGKLNLGFQRQTAPSPSPSRFRSSSTSRKGQDAPVSKMESFSKLIVSP